MIYPCFKKFELYDTSGFGLVSITSSSDKDSSTETSPVTLGEKYYYITDSILVSEDIYLDMRIDRMRRINGNFFHSFNEAKTAQNRIHKALSRDK